MSFCPPCGRIVGKLDKGESGRSLEPVYALRVIRPKRHFDEIPTNCQSEIGGLERVWQDRRTGATMKKPNT